LSLSSLPSGFFGPAGLPVCFSIVAFLSDEARGVQIALASQGDCSYPAPRRAAVAQW
jgi:hypothetical protein